MRVGIRARVRVRVRAMVRVRVTPPLSRRAVGRARPRRWTECLVRVGGGDR